jgi:hypothetical protein
MMMTEDKRELLKAGLFFAVAGALAIAMFLFFNGCSGASEETQTEVELSPVEISASVDFGLARAEVSVSALIYDEYRSIHAEVLVSIVGIHGSIVFDWDLVSGTARVCFQAIGFDRCEELAS